MFEVEPFLLVLESDQRETTQWCRRCCELLAWLRIVAWSSGCHLLSLDGAALVVSSCRDSLLEKKPQPGYYILLHHLFMNISLCGSRNSQHKKNIICALNEKPVETGNVCLEVSICWWNLLSGCLIWCLFVTTTQWKTSMLHLICIELFNLDTLHKYEIWNSFSTTSF